MEFQKVVVTGVDKTRFTINRVIKRFQMVFTTMQSPEVPSVRQQSRVQKEEARDRCN